MARVNIKGPIISSDEKWIYDWFGIEATCAADIEKAINDANGEELEVMVNSPGGYVDVGSEIYTLLKDYKGNVIVKIVGIAASAASVASMGGDIIKISPTGRFMIHNALGSVQGDYRDMDHGSEMLKECNKSIANAYLLKTGMKREELLHLMNKETFMDAQKAKELGFIDEIMFDEGNQLINNISNSMILPPEVISKIRNELENDESKTNSNDNKDLEKKLDHIINKIEKLEGKESKKSPKNEEIQKLKEKLSFKNKGIDSFFILSKQGGMNNE